jgi:hypothetical protein
MTKRDIVLLEKLFRNEMIPGSLPFPSKSRRLECLEEEGYVQRAAAILPGRFPVTVTGWALTPLGHMEYCRHCATLEMAEDDLAPDGGGS